MTNDEDFDCHEENGGRDLSEAALKGQAIAGAGCTVSAGLILVGILYVAYLLLRLFLKSN